MTSESTSLPNQNSGDSEEDIFSCRDNEDYTKKVCPCWMRDPYCDGEC